MRDVRHKLVRMRRKAMMTQEDAAHRAGISRTSLARYETGAQTPGVAACRKLARTYDVSFDDLVDAIECNGDLPSMNGGWWSNYEVFEQSAVRIRTWETMVCPGLLQVEGYSRALLGGNEELVERRMARQAILTRSHEPVELIAILDESVLHRPIGGQAVLAQQLDHLLEMGERDNVAVHILPLDAPEQAAAIAGHGAFVILEPSWPGGMVHAEHVGGARNLDHSTDMEAHDKVFDQLQTLALPASVSGRLIRRRWEELKP
jgi:DNA-binding XRE family transcriptional regulator